MRRYLLDTAVLAALLNNRPAAVALIKPWMEDHQVATSILVYAEVIEYIRGRTDFQQRQSALRRILREVYPYFLTYAILERYAEVRRQLRPPHGPGLIGDVDTLIAATAIERDLTLVTTDQDFQRVSGLKTRLIDRAELRR
ncbi:MAG TPA: type II toxin-antitoxin system VapC family toxin [Chloroflexota bacterium]|nr:type II toxin-antitoxin system VapC family toxin [Chloroflexota bacterium]